MLPEDYPTGTGAAPAPPPARPRELPAASVRTGIEATFKCEDTTEDGEDVGPLILWDLSTNEFHEELDWMRRAEAEVLAAKNGWHFNLDS